MYRLQALGVARFLGQEVQADAFFRLQADHHAVGDVLAGGVGVQVVRHVAEIDDDLGQAFLHAFAGAQEERHAGPAPVVDLGLDGDEGFGLAAGRNALLLQVADHRLASHGAGLVLAAHGLVGHILLAERAQRFQHLQLFVTYRVGAQVGRRFHRHDTEQLQQVVLHHVAQRAGAVVEIATGADAQVFRDGDLYVVNPLAAPQRFEQRVGKADGQQVLYRLLTQVVVDTVQLLFLEVAGNGFVDFVGRFQVVAQRFFQHHAHLVVVQANGGEVVADAFKQVGCGGQVADGDAVAAGFYRLGQRRVVFRGGSVYLEVLHPRQEAVPVFGGEVFLHVYARALFYHGQVVFPAHVAAAQRQDTAFFVQQAGGVGLVKRRQQLAHHQVAGAPEQHHIEGRGVQVCVLHPDCSRTRL